MDQTLAPPYSPDRFVCGESDVLVDESGNQYEKEHVNFDESSRAYYYEVQSSKEPSGVRKVHLKPLRPRCKHYKRQLVPFEGMSDRKKMIRLCTAAMNQNGEYYSLEDSEVLACEFRDPPDRESARRLEEFEEQLRRAQEEATVKEDDFDPENALGGGIFGS